MPIMIEDVVLLHIHIYCVLVSHYNAFLISLFLLFSSAWKEIAYFSVSEVQKTLVRPFCLPLQTWESLKKGFFKNQWEKSAICFSVFWESFSLQSFHSFTLVIFNVLWVSCSEIYCIIWHCILLQKLYKEAYEQSKGTSMNYCDTPKFQTDTVLKNFSDVCIWFMLCHSVLTVLITFVFQLVIIFPGKI